MIYTSYFNKVKKLDGVCYAVSGLVPQFYQKYMNDQPQKYKRYIDFSPRKQWWFKWKKGYYNNDDFIRFYKQTVLDKININEVIQQFSKTDKDIFLICYEKPSDFCHRHIISQWLKSNGFPCKQFVV